MEVPRTKTTVRNWRSRTHDSKLRRFYESLDCARLFNTRYLLDYTTVDLSGDEGRLALSIVCHIGDEKAKSRKILLDWLLREKCEFNLLDSDGLTLINWLCKNNRPALFDLFIKKCQMDIDYTTADANLDTPLMHAVRAESEEMVREILKVHAKFGISVDVQNKDGLTPYAEAVRLDFPEIAKLLQEEGKASVNVYVEPLWSLKTYDHCFKDVLNESTTIRSLTQEHVTKKDEHKTTNRKPKTHAQTTTTTKNNNNTKSKMIRKKNIIMIEPPKPIPLKSKKISKKKSKMNREKKESSSIVVPPLLSPRNISGAVSPRERRESRATMERLKKLSISQDTHRNNEQDNNKDVDKTSEESPTRILKNNSKHNGGNKMNNNSRLGEQCLWSATNSHVRRSRQNKLSGSANTTKPLRRKSIIPQRLLSTVTTLNDIESRITHEESRLAELMHYSTTANYVKAKITYDDVNNFYPRMQRVSSASRTTDQLRWLLRLRMEQNDLLPGATPPRYQLSKSEVAKVMLPTAEKTASSKSRKLGIVPSIMTSEKSSETLCNSIFNRILSSNSYS